MNKIDKLIQKLMDAPREIHSYNNVILTQGEAVQIACTLELAKRALEFYADSRNWSYKDGSSFRGYGRPVIHSEDCSRIPSDEFCAYGGKRAREALDLLNDDRKQEV